VEAIFVETRTERLSREVTKGRFVVVVDVVIIIA
jgi:hypothetical protein